jgi:hypothetical protein
MSDKIKVVNTAKNAVMVKLPAYHFVGRWDRKGSTILVDHDILEGMLNDYGARYYLDSGILYIDDMDVKKDLGLEPDDATAPKNIIVLTDEQMTRYLTVLPLGEFKQKVQALSREQKKNLVDFAIESSVSLDYDKMEYLKELTSIDIIRQRQMKKDDAQ